MDKSTSIVSNRERLPDKKIILIYSPGTENESGYIC